MPVRDPTAATKPVDAGAGRLLMLAKADIDGGRHDQALGHLREAVASSPGDPDVARAAGMLALAAKCHPEAITWLRRTVSICPDDVDTRIWLGSALSQYGRGTRAVNQLQDACRRAPASFAAWHALAELARLAGLADEAFRAARRALACEPGNRRALLTLANIQASVGDIDQAVSTLRDLLQRHPGEWLAWMALTDLKTEPLTASDCRFLERAFSVRDRDAGSRALIGFALARGLEDSHDHAHAFDVLEAANALRRRQVEWDGAALRATVDAVLRTAHQQADGADDASLGQGAIFLASVPRSGSSLVAQILASHPDVAGAGEVDHLMRLVDAESRRRGQAFPAWISGTSAQRWSRLGRKYTNWAGCGAGHGPRFVDKGMTNWLLVGIILKMLPQARIVICRRDPLETCLGCYRQCFTQGAAFTYNLDEMADYYADFDRLTRFWEKQFPGRVFSLEHAALVSDPEVVIRDLLHFCGLPFHPACLAPHLSRRMVLSAPSAAQVRQPLRRDTARAFRYGDKLDHLRARLASHGLDAAREVSA